MLLPLLMLVAAPADTVRYVVEFPNAVHHEARVSATFPAGRDSLEVWLSRSSPGRYALHEFAKNVYSVTAADAKGRALTVVQHDPYRWFVGGAHGPVTFRYTVFADRADGTYAAIDLTHAHLNMPAVFAFARGRDKAPISVRFVVPNGLSWTVATQLTPTSDPLSFTAPDLQYFMDSPTELAQFSMRTWLVQSGRGGMDTMRLAVHHTGTDADLDAYTEMAKKVVAQEIGIFGEPAPYDHHTYTFLADYVAWGTGDGMEHRNSTVISAPIMLHDNALGALGTLAHEYFHSWNMERIRSKQIEPFDFTRANASDALWFGEGFTSYFDQLSIRRAGVTSDSTYAAIVGGSVNAVVNAPGRQFFNALDMSRQAPFVDAATAIDPNNRSNTFLSYYTLGAGIGLGLDLTIRTRFPGKSLDGYMRQMWVGYGRNEKPYIVKRPYTVADLERELGTYTGDAAFARSFFAKYIRGHEVVDYAVLLNAAGIVVRPARPNVVTLGTGAAFAFDSTGAEIRRGTLIGSPLYAAGVDRGDRIRSLDGTALTSADALRTALAGKKPGDVVSAVVDQRGTRRTVPVTLANDTQLEAVLVEATGTAATPAQLQFRSSWLGSTVH